MKKLICFSLWGDHEFYNYGALENALIAKTLFPDWICRYYALHNCDQKIISELKKMDNVEIIGMPGENSNGNMFWRFSPAFMEKDVIFLSRDTDSRLNIKEKLAIDEWLASDKDFHIMRDHPHHTTEILGGTWGCRNNVLEPYKESYENFTKTNFHGLDQHFLKNIIYPHIVNNSMIHASYYQIEEHCRLFPENNYDNFIGSYIRTAPLSFALLHEENRLLDVMFPHQAEN